MQQELSKDGNKEEKQMEMSRTAPNRRACQLNAHRDDPLSLYDDDCLDGVSDEGGRYFFLPFSHIMSIAFRFVKVSCPKYSPNCCLHS